jgi:hypothetical protein
VHRDRLGVAAGGAVGDGEVVAADQCVGVVGPLTQILGRWFRPARPRSLPLAGRPASPIAATVDADGRGDLERMGLLTLDARTRTRGLDELSLTAETPGTNPADPLLSRRGALIAFVAGALTVAMAVKGVDMVIFWGTTQCALWAIKTW